MTGELIAGEGGAVLVTAAARPNVVALACEGLAAQTTTPSGTPVYPVEQLSDGLDVGRVCLLPSEERTRLAIREWAGRRGVHVVEDDPPRLQSPAGVRVVAVSAVSTGIRSILEAP